MEKTEILYGIHSVYEALKSGRRKVFEIYTAGRKASKQLTPIFELSGYKNVPVKKVTSDKINSLVQINKHQNMAAKVTSYPYEEFLPAKTVSDHPRFYLMLDHILDPQNLGAILRTALCAGVDQVIIPKDRAAGATPAVSRSSAGALEHIHLARVTNLVNCIKELKQTDFWVMGLDGQGRDSLYQMDLAVDVCIVIGGENSGLRPLVKKCCDALISIPQAGKFNSLNASAAGAVVLYEAFRQRHFGGD